MRKRCFLREIFWSAWEFVLGEKSALAFSRLTGSSRPSNPRQEALGVVLVESACVSRLVRRFLGVIMGRGRKAKAQKMKNRKRQAAKKTRAKRKREAVRKSRSS
jgi:hypothetical protein